MVWLHFVQLSPFWRAKCELVWKSFWLEKAENTLLLSALHLNKGMLRGGNSRARYQGHCNQEDLGLLWMYSLAGWRKCLLVTPSIASSCQEISGLVLWLDGQCLRTIRDTWEGVLGSSLRHLSGKSSDSSMDGPLCQIFGRTNKIHNALTMLRELLPCKQ